MLQKCIALAVLLFLSIGASSQDCSIQLSGNVIDEHDRSSLSFATIFILELEKGVAADTNGYYIFENICPGKYSLIIEHLGCEPDTVELEITGSMLKDFFLEHHAEELAGIIAVASKNAESNVQPYSAMNKNALTKLEGKDIGNILSSMPGITILKTGNNVSKPVIHGLSGDRITIVSNGVKLETQDWGSDHAPEIDPFSANVVKIIKGPESLQYGTDASGGLVLIEPPYLQKMRHIKASVSFVGQSNGRGTNASAYYSQGFEKNVAFFIQGTYKRIGDGQTPRYNLTNTGNEEGNASAGIGFLKKGWDVNAYYSFFHQQLGILKSSHIGNLTDLKNAIARDTPLVVEPFSFSIDNPKQKIAHHLAKVSIVKTLDGQNSIHLNYSYQLNNRKEFDIRRGGRSGIPALDMKLASNFASFAFRRSKRFTKKEFISEGNYGVDFLAKHNFNDPLTGIRPLIPDYYQYSAGVYDIEKLQFGNFTAEAAVRYDYTRFKAYKFDRNNNLLQPAYNFHTYAFSVGGSWKNDSSTILLQTNFTVNSRFPNASELFSEGLHHGLAALEFGNENLRPERGFKWINSINAGYKKYFRAEVSLHFSRTRNFIYLAPLPDPVLTIRGAFPAFQYFQTHAQIYGLDASLTSEPFSFLALNFRSSIVRGKNLSAKDHLAYMPADRISAGFELHNDFGRIKNIYAGLSVDHVFRQSKIPTAFNDLKDAPPAYTVLNVRTGMQVPVNEKHLLTFSVDVENITNAIYRDYLNRFRYYADELGWNLLFRVRYAFNN